jgi:glycine dehydrogenase subunit 1
MVTAATIYMSLLGPEGLRQVAAQSHASMLQLAEQLEQLPGVKRIYSAPCFHEVALALPGPVNEILQALKEQGILGGLNLQEHYPELENALLVCTTETKTADDLNKYSEMLGKILKKYG